MLWFIIIMCFKIVANGIFQHQYLNSFLQNEVHAAKYNISLALHYIQQLIGQNGPSWLVLPMEATTASNEAHQRFVLLLSNRFVNTVSCNNQGLCIHSFSVNREILLLQVFLVT